MNSGSICEEEDTGWSYKEDGGDKLNAVGLRGSAKSQRGPLSAADLSALRLQEARRRLPCCHCA